MLKRDEVCLPDSCLNKARDDEHLFVLLGRDLAAPAAIRAWIEARIRVGKNHPEDDQLAQAEGIARVMAGGFGNQPCYDQLARVLRARAQKLTDGGAAEDRDNAELVLVLARLLEGKSIYKAFGAPGDWGYHTDIGKALATSYRGAAKPAVPAGAAAHA